MMTINFFMGGKTGLAKPLKSMSLEFQRTSSHSLYIIWENIMFRNNLWRKLAAFAGLAFILAIIGEGCAQLSPYTNPAANTNQSQPLLGKRVLTFVSVIRVNQIEVARNRNAGADEGSVHTVEAVRSLRDNFRRAFPGGRMTWAFSWLALQDQRENFHAIRKQIVEYHRQFGDEITFIPGA